MNIGVHAVTVDALLADPDIEIVVNLTVPAAHAPVNLQIIEAGKHVYLEKPLATRFAEAKPVMLAAAAKGLRVGCAPDTFLGAAHQACRYAIDAGVIGIPVAGAATVLSHGMEHWHPNPAFFYQHGGGPILDLGPYYVTQLVNLLGPVSRVPPQSLHRHQDAHHHQRAARRPDDHGRGADHGERRCCPSPTAPTSRSAILGCLEAQAPAARDLRQRRQLLVPDPNFFGGEPQIPRRDGDWTPLDISRHPYGEPTAPRDRCASGRPPHHRPARHGRGHPAAAGRIASAARWRCMYWKCSMLFERSSLEGRHIVIETPASGRRSCRSVQARRCSHDKSTCAEPGIFLAQFAGDDAPFNTLAASPNGRPISATRACRSRPGTAGCSISIEPPTARPIATRSRAPWRRPALQLTELSTHLQGQLVAVHPAYDEAFDGFAPTAVRGNRAARQEWAVDQLLKAARASGQLGLTAHATFSGALAWPYIYPWPQRPPGLIETAFDELAKRWRPILDAFDCIRRRCLLRDPSRRGPARRRQLRDVPRRASAITRAASILYDPSHFVLQQLDYLGFIDIYHERIGAFHVKDAEFNPTGTAGRLWRLSSPGWTAPAGSARSATGRWISRHLLQAGAVRLSPAGRCWSGNAAIKQPEQGAREGAPFIRDHIIR